MTSSWIGVKSMPFSRHILTSFASRLSSSGSYSMLQKTCLAPHSLHFSAICEATFFRFSMVAIYSGTSCSCKSLCSISNVRNSKSTRTALVTCAVQSSGLTINIHINGTPASFAFLLAMLSPLLSAIRRSLLNQWTTHSPASILARSLSVSLIAALRTSIGRGNSLLLYWAHRSLLSSGG